MNLDFMEYRTLAYFPIHMRSDTLDSANLKRFEQETRHYLLVLPKLAQLHCLSMS